MPKRTAYKAESLLLQEFIQQKQNCEQSNTSVLSGRVAHRVCQTVNA